MDPEKPRTTAETQALLTSLYELLEALDRRVPRLERLGEAELAHGAASLRDQAMSLIRSLEGNAPME